MRRQKLEILDQEEIANVLSSSDWGTLGISQSGYPVLVPVNFVHIGSTIYLHSALGGEKFELCKKNPKGTFLVVQPYSILPSYFVESAGAWGATQLFKSVILRGRLHLVEGNEEKARALQALMVKLQPEGRYEPITAESDLYQNKLKQVAVIAFLIEDVTAKFKLGQDQTPAWRENIERCLLERGRVVDLLTVSETQRMTTANRAP